jgi:hypothetical protein
LVAGALQPISLIATGGSARLVFCGLVFEHRLLRVNQQMSTPTEFFRWWIIDERTGERRLTAYALTRADAARAFPGAEPDLKTRELRHLSEPGEAPADSRSGDR